jgi:hypothetical protein
MIQHVFKLAPLAALALPLSLAACDSNRADASTEARISAEAEAPRDRLDARRAADMLYALIEADRGVYTKHVVDRLTRDAPLEVADPESGELRPLLASERWQSEPGRLPLPSQMFKMAADEVASQNLGLHYALISEWPIGAQNRARTDAERAGLQAVGETREPVYAVETLGDSRYLTAVYPDIAVAQACVDCHNAHRDSPRSDFELGDVMGGVVVRIDLGD